MQPRKWMVGMAFLAALIGRSAAQPGTTGSADTAHAAELKAEGLALGFNLDYEQAFDVFREAITLDPDDPATHRLLAATAWIAILFDQGAVTVDDYLGQAREQVERIPPPPALAATFRTHLDKALALSEARVNANPRDAEARAQAGATYALQASYTATVDGSLVKSFGPARRAYKAHERVLALDPQKKEAGLTVGLYRYSLAALSAPARVFARIAGFDIDRASGLQLVEQAAALPTDAHTNARFSLVLLYNREKRYDDALRVIGELQRLYPRNRLLWLETASTMLRAGRFAEASDAAAHGLALVASEQRPLARGEIARWRYVHGAALVALNQPALAADELRMVRADAIRDWVRGRAEKELGKVSDLAGDRAAALQHYRDAARLCRRDNDAECRDEADALMKRSYVPPPRKEVR